MIDPDLDAKGEWTPPRSRIEERQRVMRDLRAAGYEIVPSDYVVPPPSERPKKRNRQVTTTCWGGHHPQCSGCACDCHRETAAAILEVPIRTCGECGSRYCDWWADEDLWAEIIGQYEGSLCFDCFRIHCQGHGIVTKVVKSWP